MVLSKGQLCELTTIGEGLCDTEDPSCVLTFRADSVTQELRTYQEVCVLRA
jgi:hypothetical protein